MLALPLTGSLLPGYGISVTVKEAHAVDLIASRESHVLPLQRRTQGELTREHASEPWLALPLPLGNSVSSSETQRMLFTQVKKRSTASKPH